MNTYLCTFMTDNISPLLLRQRNFSDKSSRENQNTNFIFKIFSRTSWPFWDKQKNVKSDRLQMTVHAHRMLDEQHTLRISNTHCLSTATMVTLRCLNVMLYLHWLSWSRNKILHKTVLSLRFRRKRRSYVSLPGETKEVNVGWH